MPVQGVRRGESELLRSLMLCCASILHQHSTQIVGFSKRVSSAHGCGRSLEPQLELSG